MLTLSFTGALDLQRMLCGGQSFRWRAVDGGWLGVAGAEAAFLQVRDHAVIVTGSEHEAFWRRYLALDEDYPAIQTRFRADSVLAACVDYAPGIRVLRQDFFETVACFICSACNNIPRITGIVERLCQVCGEPLGNGLFAFPTPERLAACSLSDLEPLRAGYRAPYLLASAEMIAKGTVSEAVLRSLPYPEARKRLLTLPGVGGKVADCILLFSLGFDQAFPRDVHILRGMETLFPQGLPPCAEGLEGIAQQYIFEYMRLHGKERSCG